MMVDADVMIASDGEGLRPGLKARGFEYALRDFTDNRLYARESDGTVLEWEPDARDATWLDSFEQVMGMAFALNLAEPDRDCRRIVLEPWVEIVARPRLSKEDRSGAGKELPLEGPDFFVRGIAVRDFEIE